METCLKILQSKKDLPERLRRRHKGNKAAWEAPLKKQRIEEKLVHNKHCALLCDGGGEISNNT
jgi:hypothetical protein